MIVYTRTSLDDEKKLLRVKAIRARDEVPAEQRREMSRRIIERLCSQPGIRDLKSWFVYVSFRSEVETHGLIRRLLAEGKKVTVPRIDEALKLMVPVRIRDLDVDLAPGSMGIREPKPDCLDQVDGGDIDVVIAPGAAFAPDGNRIGYGGGYYDRFLEGFQAASIGLGFDSQLFGRVPHDASRDIPLGCITTESRFIRCAGRDL